MRPDTIKINEPEKEKRELSFMEEVRIKLATVFPFFTQGSENRATNIPSGKTDGQDDVLDNEYPEDCELPAGISELIKEYHKMRGRMHRI